MLNSKTVSINHNLLKRKKAEPKLNPSDVLPLNSQAKQPNLTQDPSRGRFISASAAPHCCKVKGGRHQENMKPNDPEGRRY